MYLREFTRSIVFPDWQTGYQGVSCGDSQVRTLPARQVGTSVHPIATDANPLRRERLGNTFTVKVEWPQSQQNPGGQSPMKGLLCVHNHMMTISGGGTQGQRRRCEREGTTCKKPASTDVHMAEYQSCTHRCSQPLTRLSWMKAN